MPSRADIVIEARKWLNVPWRHQGRTRNGGIDCAGLIIIVGNSLKLIDYDTASYQRRTHGTEFLNHFKMNMAQKNPKNALPGDVLLFRDSQFPCHSTIVASIGEAQTIIHAHALRKKVVEERIDQGNWLARRVACFSYVGVQT